MIKKIFILFKRDVKVNTRDFISLYIMVAPLIMGVLINLFAPGVNDTTVNLVLIDGDDEAMVTYLSDFAKVSTVDDLDAVEERVSRRDDVLGIVYADGKYEVVMQGNEYEELGEYAKTLLAYYLDDVQIEDSTTKLNSFGREVPPLKKLLVIIVMMFASILGGMLIAINIIEEKVDKTIRAIHLTPVSRTGFILGKSVIGAIVPLVGSVLVILITGFTDINWFQMLLLIVTSMLVSILVGFIQGINNTSVMDAAGSVKMLFLPMGGAIAVAELLGKGWQWTAYWVPFYWTYKGSDEVLSYQGTWGNILLYSGIVVVISIVVYILLMPKIRKGLE